MLAAKTISTVVPKEHSVASFGAPRVSVCRVPQCVLPLLSVSFVERPALRDSVVVCAAPASSSQTAPPQRAYKKKVKKQVDINGQVVKDLGNGMFSLKLENGVKVIAHLSGRIRQARIKIVLGDTVTVELSPYDLTKGRITYRFKAGELDARKAAAIEAKANAQAEHAAEAAEAKAAAEAEA